MTVDTVTGEIVADGDMGAAEATERLARVKGHVAAAWDDLIALWSRRAWLALGHDSWDALCDAELDGARIALPRQQRREVVGRMRGAGMSTRAIGSALGIGRGTAARDSQPGVPSGTPGEESPAERPEPEPAPITGLDGKTYRRPEPSPPDPIGDAKDKAKTSPRIVAGKAIERFRDATKTVEAAGGVDAIIADTPDLDDMALLYLPDIEQALHVLTQWQAALRRRRIRSVK